MMIITSHINQFLVNFRTKNTYKSLTINLSVNKKTSLKKNERERERER